MRHRGQVAASWQPSGNKLAMAKQGLALGLSCALQPGTSLRCPAASALRLGPELRISVSSMTTSHAPNWTSLSAAVHRPPAGPPHAARLGLDDPGCAPKKGAVASADRPAVAAAASAGWPAPSCWPRLGDRSGYHRPTSVS